MTSYRHALTGRVIAPREGSALARLVEADTQWVKFEPGGSESGGSEETPKATRTRRTTKKQD